MRKQKKTKTLSINTSSRSFFVSDIHASLKLFKLAIEKINLSKSDNLFIVGDILEKGNSNLLLLDYLIELEDKVNLYILRGNCDEILRSVIMPINELSTLFFVNVKGNSILNEMLDRENIKLTSKSNFEIVFTNLYIKYKKYFDFVDSFYDLILLNDKYILVHGGIDSLDLLNEYNYYDFLKNDNYLIKGKYNEKIRIVGHFPTINYCDKIPSNKIIFNYDKNIIAIDGGNNVKLSGQINILELENDRFKSYFVDDLDYITANFNLSYQNEVICSINSYITQIHSIKEISVDYYLINDKCYAPKYSVKGKFVYFSTNYFMNININDKIAVIFKGDLYYLIKKDGDVGYILKEDGLKYGL